MDPFARQARQYVLSRPNYPIELVKRVTKLVSEGGAGRCLDVGCGSGQLTVQLAEHFKEVVGVDRSEPQLKNALKHPRVKYFRVEDAVDLSRFPDATFDCLTVAQTLHWLPIEPALKEFHRVLKPGGGFAALGYGCCKVESSREFAFGGRLISLDCDLHR
jgi:ubiquinone/menaquinone biosynthesis C-methylase UbiE